MIPPIGQPDGTSFGGYKFKLKTLYRQGKLPKDLVDIGGNKITQKNLSGDHAIPKCKGGKCNNKNMMLATKEFNSLRGSRDLKEVVTTQSVARWSEQMLSLQGKVKGFDFVEYVRGILKIIGDTNG